MAKINMNKNPFDDNHYDENGNTSHSNGEQRNSWEPIENWSKTPEALRNRPQPSFGFNRKVLDPSFAHGDPTVQQIRALNEESPDIPIWMKMALALQDSGMANDAYNFWHETEAPVTSTDSVTDVVELLQASAGSAILNHQDIEDWQNQQIDMTDAAMRQRCQNRVYEMANEYGISVDEARDRFAQVAFGEHGNDGIFSTLLEGDESMDMAQRVLLTSQRYMGFDVSFDETGAHSYIPADEPTSIDAVDAACRQRMQNKVYEIALSDNISIGDARNQLAEVAFGTDGTDGAFSELLEGDENMPMSQRILETSRRYLGYDVIMDANGIHTPDYTDQLQSDDNLYVSHNEVEAPSVGPSVGIDGAAVPLPNVESIEIDHEVPSGAIGSGVGVIYPVTGPFPSGTEDGRLLNQMYNAAANGDVLPEVDSRDFIQTVGESFGITDNVDATAYASHLATSNRSPYYGLYQAALTVFGDDPETKKNIAQAMSATGLSFGIDDTGNLCFDPNGAMFADMASTPAVGREDYSNKNWNEYFETMPDKDEAMGTWMTLVNEGVSEKEAMNLTGALLNGTHIVHSVTQNYNNLLETYPQLATFETSAATAIATVAGVDPSVGVAAVSTINAGSKALETGAEQAHEAILQNQELFDNAEAFFHDELGDTVENIKNDEIKPGYYTALEEQRKGEERNKKSSEIIPATVDGGYDESQAGSDKGLEL